MIYKLRDILDLNTLRTYYLANVQSVLAYGIILWGASPRSADVFKLQKRFIRCILRLDYCAPCRGHFKELKLLTLPCLYIYHLLIYCRNNLREFPTNAHFSKSLRTRNADRLALPRHASSIFEGGPTFMMIRCYNALPAEILASETISKYRTKLMHYLISNAFYSVTEFMVSVS